MRGAPALSPTDLVLGEQYAPMAQMSVVVERISGGKFVIVGNDEAVKPRETIRLFVSAVGSGLDINVDYKIRHLETDAIVLERSAGLQPFTGNAWLDVTAPSAPGDYIVAASVSGWFGWGGQTVTTGLKIRTNAEDPSEPPPDSGVFGDIKGLVKFGAIAIGGILLITAVGKIPGGK